MSNLETFKAQAAIQAAQQVESGMWVGLGTGSTAKYAVLEIGRRMQQGELRDLRAVPTSRATAALAVEQGIPLFELEPYGVDLTIDGADEIDPQLNLIKGLGGALLREKLVETASRRFVVIADHTKRVDALGRGVLPVEIVSFGYKTTLDRLGAYGEPQLWLKDGQPFITDGGNYAVKLTTGPIANPAELEQQLKALTGVVDSGLFVGLAQQAIVASSEGIQVLEPQSG